MGVCEPLMPNVPAPKADQNDHSYVSSADLPLELPSDSTQKKFAWWGAYMENLENHKTVKIGGCMGTCPGVVACPRQYGSDVPLWCGVQHLVALLCGSGL